MARERLPVSCPQQVRDERSRLFSSRENMLVLDIFFEALNYETVEQKKAYEVSELLGMCTVPGEPLARGGLNRWL